MKPLPQDASAPFTTDVVVVGGGPAGLTAAVAIAGAGVDTVLLAPASRPDNRTTALLAGSVAALEALSVWPRCRDHAAPLRAIRIIDDRGGLLRAPEVTFRADEIGLDAFGHNIENRHLLAGLEDRAGELPTLRIIRAAASEIVASEACVMLRLDGGGSLQARIAIGADGRNSLCRDAAAITADQWTYPQTALTCNLDHRRSHSDISTEFHTGAGPFTLVPLPGMRASLVWVMRPDEAARLGTLDDTALSAAIERQSHSLLGKVKVGSERGLFALTGLTARRVAGNRIALVGEAAHVIPPIGAQGFNLGLRDAATIGELIVGAWRDGIDIGSQALLRRYEEKRRADIASRTFAVDLLNRSLLTDLLPLQGMRGLGLHLLARFAWLRQAMMREGVAPETSAPQLMRGEPL